MKDERKAKLEKRAKKKEQEEEEGGWEKVTGGFIQASQEKKKLFTKGTEINIKSVLNKIQEIISARGKKGTNRSAQISQLIELRSIANEHNIGPAMDIKILHNIVSSIFDYNPNISTCMRDNLWSK